MNVRREQPASTPATAAQAMVARMAPRIAATRSGGRIAPSALQAALELGLAARAVHHLALQLAAGRIDVVAAGAAHRRDHAGVVELLLERADRFIGRALVARAGERVERDQVDLGRV